MGVPKVLNPKYNTTKTTLLESVVDNSNTKTLLQVLTDDDISFNDLADLRNDFEVSKESIKGLLRSIDFIKYKTGVAIVKEFFEGQTLHAFLDQESLSLREKIILSKNLTEAINNLHVRGFVHRDIAPENILVDPKTLEVRIASVAKTARAIGDIIHGDLTKKIEGSISYISPEQTGRMNRSIDYRTDVYSLGIIYYEIFSGRLPFLSTDLLQTVYAHIAKIPTPPKEINPQIPKVISDLIMTMIRKNAEDRYQSLSGILDDLTECEKRLDNQGKIEYFTLGKTDQATTFNISEKLYGREVETQQLIDTYEKAMREGVSLLVVGGYAGVGKTRLINEIYKPLARENGNFISGKFDQYSQNSPYSGFVQAFKARINQILAESETKVAFWKSRIIEALAENGSLIVDLVTDLQHIIGDQPKALKLGFNESHARFRKVFCDFVNALASEFEPLVFFMDDLQWADSDSIDLIYALLNAQEVKHILMICAYRDNEVNSSHPFHLMLKRLESGDTRVEFVKVKDLSKANVQQLVADSLKLPVGEVNDLSELIYKKTAGNPFFINQFLQNLVQHGIIYFDLDQRLWRWQNTGVKQWNITDNVVDLVVYKLQTLSESAQIVLRLAAAVGNTFDISTVSTISRIGRNEVANLVWDAVDLNFIQPTGLQSRHVNDAIWDEIGIDTRGAENLSFRFQHDKIQQAAYFLIDEKERKKTHYEIGSLLLSEGDKRGEIDNLYEVVNHLNLGSDLISSMDELIHLAKLNLKIGNIVKDSNSYEASLEYLRKATELIVPSDDAGLYRRILISRSEAEYLNGHYEKSEKMYDIALDNADSGLLKAEIFAEKMKLYENTSRHAEAIQSALEGLRLLGLTLPEKPGTLNIMKNLVQTKLMLRNKTIDDLKQLPVMEQPELILKMKILMNLWGPAYLSNPNLLVLAILKLVQLSVKMGNAPESALAFAFYGYVSCAQLKEFEKGHEYAKLGLWLNDRFNDKTYRAKVYVIYAGCVAHWREPFTDTVEWLRKANLVGQESNDLVYAGYAYNFLSKNQFWSGEHLESLTNKFVEYVHFARSIQSQTTLHHLLAVARMLYNLLGWEYSKDIFQDSMDENHHLKQMTALAEDDGIWLPLVCHRIHQAY
ncbi:MAG: serine/threonine-protein kinase PknK, partial [Saprospiraceae bacterium]|nr:serine/threonine-protein kinase PknK [Saprospiraceae bacterium]